MSISVCAAAQDSTQTQGTPPAPAFGQTAPILNPDNPPLSGLDEPSLELKTASRSFISPALQVGQSADSNSQNTFNGSRSAAVSHILGAMDLQKFWPRSDLFLEYLGGGSFGDNPFYARQIQAAGLEAITRWRTGQVTLRDSFSYLPDGSFYAASAGGLPGFGIATGGIGLGLPGIFHLVFGSVGTIPRLGNTAVIDAVQAITPRSAITVVGAFTNAHFYHNVDDLVDGDESTIEAGYSHLVNRHDQVAFVYAAQLFRFPDTEGGEIYNNVINIRWSHTISGRMSFVGGVGPQITDLKFGGSFVNVSVAGRAILRYKLAHSSLLLGYEKFTSQGSGFFAGSDTQRVQFTIRRPIGRTLDISADAGFAHNKRLQPFELGGASANSYNEVSAGAVLRKHLNRTFDFIMAYRYSEIDFSSPQTFAGSTGRVNQRQIGTIALDWHPKAIRIE